MIGFRRHVLSNSWKDSGCCTHAAHIKTQFSSPLTDGAEVNELFHAECKASAELIPFSECLQCDSVVTIGVMTRLGFKMGGSSRELVSRHQIRFHHVVSRPDFAFSPACTFFPFLTHLVTFCLTSDT